MSGPPAATPGRTPAAPSKRTPAAPRRRTPAAAWAALAGSGRSVTAAIGLLVLACVFGAVAGPRASLGMRTSALGKSVASLAPLSMTVFGSAGYTDFSSGLHGPFDATAIGQARRLLAGNLAGDGVRLAPSPADWSGINTGPATVTSGAPDAVNFGEKPVVEVLYRDTLSGHARLLAGRWPDAAAVAGVRTVFEAAVTSAMAARFGLRPGSQVHLGAAVTLTVTGVISPEGTSSPFWTADPTAATPQQRYINDNVPPYWVGSAFVGPAEIARLPAAFDVTKMNLLWDFPLDLHQFTASKAAPLSDALSRAALNAGQLQSADGLLAGMPEPVDITSGLSQPLAQFSQQDDAVGRVLDLLFISLAFVGAVVVLLGARLLCFQRARELSVLRARGASQRQLSSLVLRPVAAVTIPAALAGAGIAIALTPGDGTTVAWWLAGLTVLAALAGPPLAVIRAHRPAAESFAGRADTPPSRRAAARRVVIEGALVAAAAGGLVLLRSQGQPTSDGLDLYTSMTPALIAIPAAIVIMRCYPPAVRGLLWLTAKRPGITAFVGLAQAARTSLSAILPAFALILALTVIAFGTMLGGAVSSGEVAASWQQTGADAIVNPAGSTGSLSAATQRAIAAVPGVVRTAVVTVESGYSPQTISAGLTPGFVIVNPGAYAGFVAATPEPAFPAAKLAATKAATSSGGVVPVLATAQVAAALGGAVTRVHIGLRSIPVRVAGVISGIPGVPGSAQVVMPDWALRASAPGGQAQTTLLLVAGTGLDQGRLAAVVQRLLPGATLTLRATALSALTGAPLPHGAYLAFAAGAVAAAALSVVILVIMLLLGARPRALTLGRLLTMGLRRRQARWLAAIEIAPQVFASAVGGIVCAIALAPLIGPAIDLSAFTGGTTTVPIRAEPGPLTAAITGLAVLAVFTVAAQTYVTYRRGAARALRMDDA